MKSLVTAGLAALTLSLATPALAQDRQNTALVLDASGSMWGQIDGLNEIPSGTFTFTANLGGEEIGDEPVWDQASMPLDIPLLSGEVIWEISDTGFNMMRTGTVNPFTADLPFGDYIVTVHSTAQDDFSQTEISLASDSARNIHAIFPPIAPERPLAQVFDPAQAVVGSAFRVTWEGEDLPTRDSVTIVPADAEDGIYGDYDRLEEPFSKSRGPRRAVWLNRVRE